MPLYLRIAPELYLKRSGGGRSGSVFEINRNFRNGDEHPPQPEFTMMSSTETYRDYKYLMDYTERLFRFVAQKCWALCPHLSGQTAGSGQTVPSPDHR